jgi:hypothetical protein
MKKRNFNLLMVVQWLIFMPLLLPMGLIAGAIEGVKKTFEQANADIFHKETSISETLLK